MYGNGVLARFIIPTHDSEPDFIARMSLQQWKYWGLFFVNHAVMNGMTAVVNSFLTAIFRIVTRIDIWYGEVGITIDKEAQSILDENDSFAGNDFTTTIADVGIYPRPSNSSNNSFLIYPLSPNILPVIPSDIEDRLVRFSPY